MRVQNRSDLSVYHSNCGPLYFLTVIMKYAEDANFGTYSSILFLSYHFAACFKVIDK